MKSPARRAEDAAAASQAQQLAADALRQMLTGCTAVESIIVMDLLQRSHDLARAVANLASAMRHDGEPQFIVEGQRYGPPALSATLRPCRASATRNTP